MDEYTCPNCGAILNNQVGFEPSEGTWTCTECGMHLMDDDIYEGDSYEGVAWYCDNCGTLLNRQFGFSDSYGCWRCTECGYNNGITDDDIVTDVEDELKCPSCGDSLRNQFCFSEYSYDWKCTSCGAKLHKEYSDDSFEVVEENDTDDDDELKCPNCGDSLRNQFCFSEYSYDWECTSCGVKLHKEYSSDPFEVVEEDDELVCPNCGDSLEEQVGFSEYNDDWKCTSCGIKLHRDYLSESYEISSDEDGKEEVNSSSYSYSYSGKSEMKPESLVGASTKTTYKKKTKRQRKINRRKRRVNRFFRRHGKGIFLFLASVIFISYVASLDEITVGVDSVELEELHYEQVGELLLEAGFTNIEYVNLDDLKIDEVAKEYMVETVSIGGDTEFDADTTYFDDVDIIVTYHTVKKIAMSFSYKDIKGNNYVDVISKLEAEGFVNIKTEAIYDIITGWITSEGEIDYVAIGGNKKFKEGKEFRPDVEVVVAYHTYKKNAK